MKHNCLIAKKIISIQSLENNLKASHANIYIYCKTSLPNSQIS